ncbi:hypothetical protein QUF75_00300 [Desulfococcaceae bacterium HSG7]|nr:hypothetical protein [Desulfococcaceae bacterium HSG7]
MNYLKAFCLSLVIMASPLSVHAAVTEYTPHTWDDAGGLNASVSYAMDTVGISGTRKSAVPWGQGGVNYQAGVTSNYRLPGTGELEVDVLGTNGAYGSGTGYKVLVQFWNDEQNYIALGIIHDPGPSPDGMTVMVEGAAYNGPVGGYWGADRPVLTGAAHHFSVRWTPTEISWTINNLEQYRMTFAIKMDNPSFSILSAARDTGDSVSASFENIYLSNPPDIPIAIPACPPRATISADVKYQARQGNVGWAAYLNIHDAYNNAISFGVQADRNDVNTSAAIAYVHHMNVAGSIMSHRYHRTAVPSDQEQNWELRYWDNTETCRIGKNRAAKDDTGKAILFIGGVAVGEAFLKLQDRLFFQPEINAAQNGDCVYADFYNTIIGGSWADGSAVAPNGTWNTSDFNFWGLDSSQLNSLVQGANFYLNGCLAGLPAGCDWDSIQLPQCGSQAPTAAIAMIAEWWYNQ